MRETAVKHIYNLLFPTSASADLSLLVSSDCMRSNSARISSLSAVMIPTSVSRSLVISWEQRLISMKNRELEENCWALRRTIVEIMINTTNQGHFLIKVTCHQQNIYVLHIISAFYLVKKKVFW